MFKDVDIFILWLVPRAVQFIATLDAYVSPLLGHVSREFYHVACDERTMIIYT